MNINAKFFNKTLSNQIQQYIKKIKTFPAIMERQVDMLCFLIKPKGQKKLKNKKQPELPENLSGSPTTKQLKKKHSSRLIGGVETGSRGGEDTRRSE